MFRTTPLAASSVDEAPRSSAVLMRIEAPKGVGVFFFAFGSQNCEFWFILGHIFTVELLDYRLR